MTIIMTVVQISPFVNHDFRLRSSQDKPFLSVEQRDATVEAVLSSFDV